VPGDSNTQSNWRATAFHYIGSIIFINQLVYISGKARQGYKKYINIRKHSGGRETQESFDSVQDIHMYILNTFFTQKASVYLFYQC
jgi:hypothetical protein